MSPGSDEASPWSFRFPRVSGDEPLPTVIIDGDIQFSPRERG